MPSRAPPFLVCASGALALKMVQVPSTAKNIHKLDALSSICLKLEDRDPHSKSGDHIQLFLWPHLLLLEDAWGLTSGSGDPIISLASPS